MSALDLNVFREILEKDRSRLIDEIQAETAKLNSYTEVNPDPFDLADKSFQQDITAGRLRYMKRNLKQVEAALKRIQEKTYGICVRCGKHINPERLEAMPYATLCVNCKKGQEHPS
jgi:DnaK suppressor protein